MAPTTGMKNAHNSPPRPAKGQPSTTAVASITGSSHSASHCSASSPPPPPPPLPPPLSLSPPPSPVKEQPASSREEYDRCGQERFEVKSAVLPKPTCRNPRLAAVEAPEARSSSGRPASSPSSLYFTSAAIVEALYGDLRVRRRERAALAP